MLYVNKIYVTDQFGLDRLLVTFSINNTPESLDDYRFDLYRSLNPENDWNLLAVDVQNFSYEDYNVNLFNRSLHYYYKVLVTKISTGDEAWSDLVGSYMGHTGDNYANAIIAIESKYLDNVVANTKLDLYKRRQSGQICSCYDEVRRRSDPKCPICLGTQIVGGYYPPVTMNVNFFNVMQRQHRMEPFGDFDDTAPQQLWTKNYPLIANEDVFVDQFNDAHIVTNWTPSYKNSFLLRQTMAVARIPRTSIFYQILKSGGQP